MFQCRMFRAAFVEGGPLPGDDTPCLSCGLSQRAHVIGWRLG